MFLWTTSTISNQGQECSGSSCFRLSVNRNSSRRASWQSLAPGVHRQPFCARESICSPCFTGEDISGFRICGFHLCCPGWPGKGAVCIILCTSKHFVSYVEGGKEWEIWGSDSKAPSKTGLVADPPRRQECTRAVRVLVIFDGLQSSCRAGSSNPRGRITVVGKEVEAWKGLS